MGPGIRSVLKTPLKRRWKMRHLLVWSGLFFLLLYPSFPSTGEETLKTELRVSSPVFDHKGNLPRKYACDGANVNPPLRIDNIPPQAKILALVLDDADAPRGTYVHWILWNISPLTKEIKENSVPEGAVEGTNDFKKQNYGGPCPPSRAHRYVFKLYALDTQLQLDPSSTKQALEKAMKGHIISEAEMIVSYKKEKKK
jgi:Raf kinase inhibitor-like YbhB/YbcL family protein